MTAPTIRLATPDDASPVAAVYAPYCLTPVSFEAAPPGVGEVRVRIARTLVRHPWLVCEARGEVVGYAYAGPHRDRAAYRWSADTSVYVRPDRHRSGVGRGLYTSLLGLLAVQGYVNAFAGVALPNPASVGLHRAMGFDPVGVYRRVGYKGGSWHDVGWYHRPLGPPPADPAPPKEVEEACGTAEWLAALAAGVVCLRS